MNLAFIKRGARKHIDGIMKKHKKKMLMLCLFLASISVGVVCAVIYNWMYVQGSATIV